MSSLAPIATVAHPDCRQTTPSADFVQCGRCSKVYRAGAVVNDDPQIVADFRDGRFQGRAWVMLRRLYCDHCNHIQNWRETSTRDGRPLGTVVMGPGYVKGRKAVTSFLNAFPQAAGVLQN